MVNQSQEYVSREADLEVEEYRLVAPQRERLSLQYADHHDMFSKKGCQTQERTGSSPSRRTVFGE